MRQFNVLAALALGVLAPAAAAEVARPYEGTVLPVAEVREGMEGYGLTVFHGSRIDTFGVRVLGVQRGARPAGSIILAELSGHGLETSSIPQGMSGSPVFLEGKLAGAVAFGWPGALKPIAGLTPAEEILALPQPAGDAAAELQTDAAGPDPLALLDPESPGRELAARILGDLVGRAPPADRGAAASPEPGPHWPEPAELAVQLLRAVGGEEPDGFGRSGEGWRPLPAALLVAPLGAAGEAAADGAMQADVPFLPGSACGVPLVLGDAQMGAIGTATWVDGDRVFLMGHPFMQQGPVQLPLAAAEVFGIFPSRQVSFKLGAMGPVVGSVHHDLRAGLSGRLGDPPPMTPVKVTLERPEGTDRYAFRVVRDARLTPALVFWSLYNALLVRGDDMSLQSIRYDLLTTWRRTGGARPETVRLRGGLAGPGGAARLAPDLMAPLQILMANRHAPLSLESVEAVLTVERPMETAEIAAAVAATTARAGQRLPVRVILQPRRGTVRTVTRELDLPPHLAPGRYRIVVASGRDMFALEAARAAARFQDRSLAATLELIRQPRDAATLVVALLARSQGVLVDGRELPDLPGSVRALMERDGTGRVQPTAAGLVLRAAVDTDHVLQGFVVRELVIQKPSVPSREERRP